MYNIINFLTSHQQFILYTLFYVFLIFIQSIISPTNHYLLYYFNYEITNPNLIHLFNLKNLIPIIVQTIFYILFYVFYNLSLLFKTNLRWQPADINKKNVLLSIFLL